MTNSVYMDPSVGGDGKTYTDDTDPNTGMDDGGHRLRLIPMLGAIIKVAQFILTKAAEAANSAASAVLAPGTTATSTTNVALPDLNGTMTLTIQTNKAITPGQTVVAAATADKTQQAIGPITAYDPTTGGLSFKALYVNGSGTYNSWNVGLSAPVDASLTGRVTAVEAELDRIKARKRLFYKDLT